MAINYKLGRFSDETFSATKLEWEQKAGAEEFASEYAIVFESAASKLDYDKKLKAGETGQCYWGVFAPGAQAASAMVDIVNSRKPSGAMAKVMKIYITPDYWKVTEHHPEIVELYTSAIVGVVEQTQAPTLKLFGRSDSLLQLLQDLNEALNSNGNQVPGLTVSMQGRWLVMEV